MKTRHKPPSLVSMWMLDVFCCALGCVTLLWLLSTREAKTEAARNASAVALLAKTEAELKAKSSELMTTLAEFTDTKRRLNAEIESLQARYLALTEDRDSKAKQLLALQGDLNSTQTQLAQTITRRTEVEEELAKKRKQTEDLTKQLTSTEKSSSELANLLRLKSQERDEVVAKSKQTQEQLNDLDAKLRAASRDLETANANAANMKRNATDLATANAMIIDLQGQKAKLADKFDKLQKESETRFAGIALTGRRVAFVIDISGSMKLIDDKTPAPSKWPTVIETLAKVMRSLPELEQFQIIVFSREARSLMGPGWQQYRGEASIREVSQALHGVNPDGDTNLYDALDLAFRLRPSGLDTLYLLSDGLPTSGPGINAEQERNITLTERSDKLSKHVLRTLKSAWNTPQNGKKVRINAVGFFFESPEVGAFLWALARDNDGSFVGMSKP
ncbi:MAG: VWA domain-containing protein [Fimbriiglobus sp.]